MPNKLATFSRVAILSSALFALPQCAVAGAFCGDRLEGGWASGSTENEARDAAVQWWSSRAGSVGRGYEHWESAADKNVQCKGANDGGSSAKCIASARPCLPDGVVPENVPKVDL
jgi:hypothetical protein